MEHGQASVLLNLEKSCSRLGPSVLDSRLGVAHKALSLLEDPYESTVARERKNTFPPVV